MVYHVQFVSSQFTVSGLTILSLCRYPVKVRNGYRKRSHFWPIRCHVKPSPFALVTQFHEQTVSSALACLY